MQHGATQPAHHFSASAFEQLAKNIAALSSPLVAARALLARSRTRWPTRESGCTSAGVADRAGVADATLDARVAPSGARCCFWRERRSAWAARRIGCEAGVAATGSVRVTRRWRCTRYSVNDSGTCHVAVATHDAVATRYNDTVLQPHEESHAAARSADGV